MSTHPYTHADHWKRGIEASKRLQMVERTHVQVRKGPVIYCAQILEAYTVPNGPDCWTVESLYPQKARFTVPCKNVRLCESSTCTCGPVFGTAAGRSVATAMPQMPQTGKKG